MPWIIICLIAAQLPTHPSLVVFRSTLWMGLHISSLPSLFCLAANEMYIWFENASVNWDNPQWQSLCFCISHSLYLYYITVFMLRCPFSISVTFINGGVSLALLKAPLEAIPVERQFIIRLAESLSQSSQIVGIWKKHRMSQIYRVPDKIRSVRNSASEFGERTVYIALTMRIWMTLRFWCWSQRPRTQRTIRVWRYKIFALVMPGNRPQRFDGLPSKFSAFGSQVP